MCNGCPPTQNRTKVWGRETAFDAESPAGYCGSYGGSLGKSADGRGARQVAGEGWFERALREARLRSHEGRVSQKGLVARERRRVFHATRLAAPLAAGRVPR